jgi:hypothetical protein
MRIKALRNNHGLPTPSGYPAFHEILAWFATEDDRLLGALIRDRVDHDFSWVVLALDPVIRAYRAIDMESSLPTAATATAELHARECWNGAVGLRLMSRKPCADPLAARGIS